MRNNKALSKGRDWSVWIDTIETLFTVTSVPDRNNVVGIDLFGLIRLKLKDTLASALKDIFVGIDLFGLIRLKQPYRFNIFRQFHSRDWSVWIDTIETSCLRSYVLTGLLVGIDTIETAKHSSVFMAHFVKVGIDLSGLIRLKRF